MWLARSHRSSARIRRKAGPKHEYAAQLAEGWASDIETAVRIRQRPHDDIIGVVAAQRLKQAQLELAKLYFRVAVTAVQIAVLGTVLWYSLAAGNG